MKNKPFDPTKEQVKFWACMKHLKTDTLINFNKAKQAMVEAYKHGPKKYKIKKPKGTFYTDYFINNGNCYAVFEYENRVIHTFVCKTTVDFSVEITETKNYYYITI